MIVPDKEVTITGITCYFATTIDSPSSIHLYGALVMNLLL